MSVAVMVDLGWPWWVISLIAAGVVAGALIAFAVSRRPAVRGIAALLIVQGVAIAIVAPFVMEDDEGGSERERDVERRRSAAEP